MQVTDDVSKLLKLIDINEEHPENILEQSVISPYHIIVILFSPEDKSY